MNVLRVFFAVVVCSCPLLLSSCSKADRQEPSLAGSQDLPSTDTAEPQAVAVESSGAEAATSQLGSADASDPSTTDQQLEATDRAASDPALSDPVMSDPVTGEAPPDSATSPQVRQPAETAETSTASASPAPSDAPVSPQPSDSPQQTASSQQATTSRSAVLSRQPRSPAPVDKVVERKSSSAARAKGEINFDDLKFDLEKDAPFQEDLLTDEIRQLDGTNVKLRGYILPSTLFSETNISQFVLVRDNQECCFGPGAALFDCVMIQMVEGKTTDFVTRPVTVEGKFVIDTESYRYPPGFAPTEATHMAVFRIEGESVD